MKRRTSLFVILLSALLMISMMSAMAFAKDKKDAPKKEKAEKHHVVKTDDVSVQGGMPVGTKIYVGGQEVTGPGQIQGDGITGYVYIDFDENGAILTLRNAVITGKKDVDDNSYNIYSDGVNLTIVLEGENVVNSEDVDSGIAPADYAIDSYDNMTITGDGSLTVKGDDSAIYLDDYHLVISGGNVVATSNDNDAIFLGDGDCTIKDAHVEAYAYADYDDAICVYEGACRIENADVIAESEAGKGIYTEDPLTINGTVEATGTNYGIYSEYGPITINGTVEATGNYGIYSDDDSITINGTVNATGTDYGIYSDGGSITINGGNVTATGGNDFGIDADDDLIINGGTVTAKGARGGMRTWGGSVKANGGTIISTQTGGGGDDPEPTSVKVAGDVADDAGIASFSTVIGKGVVSLVSSGTDKAISGKVKNEIAGTGWESADESGTKTGIDVNTAEEGQDLSKYKRVQFPEKVDPAPTPTPTPTPAANVPTVKTTAKTSAKSMTVKWSWDKVNGATKYKVAYRKVGSKKWTTKTTKKTKYVIKGHKIRGLYEYKVAAVTSSGDVWSKVSCRYFKGAKIRAKVSKGVVRVSWKQDKSASGYQVLVAKNKKMNGAKVFNVAASKKTYNVSGLEKGKYYVKVRPMKKHDGTVYKGVMSKAQTVRIK